MDLTIAIRDKIGKGHALRGRKSNRIPGILYGREFSPKPVEVDTVALHKALLAGAGDSHLIDLTIESPDGKTAEKGLIKAIQRHPVTDRVMHVDFYRVRMTDKIEVDVALQLTGTPLGIKKGGVMEKRLNTIRVRCLPSNIPDHFTLDVSSLDVGGNLKVSNLQTPPDVTILNDPEQTLVVVTEVKEEKVEVAAVAAEPGAVPAEGAPAAGAEAASTDADKKEGTKDKPKKG